jgi:hypothetical protein
MRAAAISDCEILLTASVKLWTLVLSRFGFFIEFNVSDKIPKRFYE